MGEKNGGEDTGAASEEDGEEPEEGVEEEEEQDTLLLRPTLLVRWNFTVEENWLCRSFEKCPGASLREAQTRDDLDVVLLPPKNTENQPKRCDPYLATRYFHATTTQVETVTRISKWAGGSIG